MASSSFMKKVQHEFSDTLAMLESEQAKSWSKKKKQLAEQINSKTVDDELAKEVKSIVIPSQLHLIAVCLDHIKKIDRVIAILNHNANYVSHHEQQEHHRLISELRTIEKKLTPSFFTSGIERILHQQHDSLHHHNYSKFIDLLSQESKFMLRLANSLDLLQVKQKKSSSSFSKKIFFIKNGVRVIVLGLVCTFAYGTMVFTSPKSYIDDVNSYTHLLVELKEELGDSHVESELETSFESHTGIEILGDYTQKDMEVLQKAYVHNMLLFKKSRLKTIVFVYEKNVHSPLGKSHMGSGTIFVSSDKLQFGYLTIIHELYHEIHGNNNSKEFKKEWQSISGGIVNTNQKINFLESVAYFAAHVHYFPQLGHKIPLKDKNIDAALARIHLLIKYDMFPEDVAHKLKHADLKALFE